MAIDQASAEVIAQTRPAHQRFVRLYFRPRTPTQYHNEGIRPPGIWSKYAAHCPVPVFFCFDFVETLGMDGTQFSDGNMARPSAKFGDSEEFFDELPFESIYHDGPIIGDNQHSIVFHRHAEVLVPNSLALNHKLRAIVCRSAAERLTLLHMLKPRTRRAWSEQVRVAPTFFCHRWWYVKNVKAGQGSIDFELSDASCDIELSYRRALPSGRLRTATTTLRKGATSWRVWALDRDDGVVAIRLAGNLAFQAVVVLSDAPF